MPGEWNQEQGPETLMESDGTGVEVGLVSKFGCAQMSASIRIGWLKRRKVGQNSQELGREYLATHSTICSFARTAHSFARLLTHSILNSWERYD